MTGLPDGTDIVQRALAVLDSECEAWAARKRPSPHPDARPRLDPGPSEEPSAGAER